MPFLFRPPSRSKLFRVKGDDDTAHASWRRLGDLSPDEVFEDHRSIIEETTDL